jgi:deoxynucleoside triphosphate triphosphohydrolase SAMHD1
LSDKIDYYARDERRAFKGAGEIDVPMIEEAVVAWAACEDPTACHKCRYRKGNNQHSKAQHPNGTHGQDESLGPRHLMICYPQKHIPTCMDFFKKRFELHTKIYSHKTAVGTAHLICDILCAADPHFRLPVLRGNSSLPRSEAVAAAVGNAKREYASLPISRAFVDPDVYLRCRDSVLDQIANTTDPNLAEARHLISRLWSRDIYKCAIFKVMDMPSERALWALSEKEIADGMLQVRGVHRDETTGSELKLERRDILIHKCNIHHGSKDDNPLLQMRFIEKHQLHKLTWPLELLPEAGAVQESRYDARLPRHFAERSLRIYSRNPAKESLVRHVFEQWYAEFQGELELTPLAMDALASKASFGMNPDGQQQGGSNGQVAFFCSQESNDENDDECLGDYDEAGRGLDRSPVPRRSPGGTGGGLGQVTPVRR